MDKELALRTFGYLIGHYKTHNETTINSQEIEAIEFMLKNNEDLEQQVKKQKEVIDKAIELTNNFAFKILADNRTMYIRLKDLEQGKDLLDVLKDKEV